MSAQFRVRRGKKAGKDSQRVSPFNMEHIRLSENVFEFMFVFYFSKTCFDNIFIWQFFNVKYYLLIVNGLEMLVCMDRAPFL